MQYELLHFERNRVWTFVPQPEGKIPIYTKWVLKNKKDEDGVVLTEGTKHDWLLKDTAKRKG